MSFLATSGMALDTAPEGRASPVFVQIAPDVEPHVCPACCNARWGARDGCLDLVLDSCCVLPLVSVNEFGVKLSPLPRTGRKNQSHASFI